MVNCALRTALAGLKSPIRGFSRAHVVQKAPLGYGRLECFHGETGSAMFVPDGRRRRDQLRLAGAGGHRHHVVARDVGRTRAATGTARGGFQRIAVRIPHRSELQGELHRKHHRCDLCVSVAQPARHRPGQRNRDRDHDGRARRDLSGVRVDARPVGSVLPCCLSSGRYRLLYRCRRQHVVVPVQRLDADPLLQQGPVPFRRPRSPRPRRRPGPNWVRRRESCARPVPSAGSPPPGRHGSTSRIFPPTTICRSRPKPTASAASMPCSISTIR